MRQFCLLLFPLSLLLFACGSDPEVPAAEIDVEFYYPVANGNDWQIIDETGQILWEGKNLEAPPVYHDGWVWSRTKSGVAYDQLPGTIRKGNVLSAGGIFSEGLAPVVVQEYAEVVFMDPTTNIVIDEHFGFEEASVFSEGLAAAKKNGQWGFIDKTGAWVIEPFLDSMPSVFINGLSVYQQYGKFGYLDSTGQKAISPQFESATPFFTNLALVSANGKYGYIDRSGNFRSPPSYERAAPYFGPTAPVYRDRFWGYADTNGVEIIPCKFQRAKPFAGGLAAVTEGENWGFIDGKGNYLIEPAWEEAASFYGPLAPVKKGGKWGFIDRKGNLVIEPQYDYIHSTPANPKLLLFLNARMPVLLLEDPMTVARKFLTHLFREEFEEAKKYGSSETGEALDLMINIGETSGTWPESFEIISQEVIGKTATVVYETHYVVEGKREETLTLVKEGDEWRVAMEKEGLLDAQAEEAY